MNRRNFIKTTGYGAGLAVSLSTPVFSSTPSGKRPNVLFMLVDDMNDWVHAMGHDQAITPNIDRIAKRGLLFSDAHVAGIYCAPSRSALLFGQAPWRTGIYANQQPLYHLPDLKSLPKCFKENGYEVAGGGKVFHHPKGCVDLEGYHEYYIWNEDFKKTGWELKAWGDGSPKPANAPVSPTGKNTWSNNDYAQLDNDLEEKMADSKTVAWAVDYLKRDHQKPFFLTVGTYAPHLPYYIPKKYFDMYSLDKIQTPEIKKDDVDDLPPRTRSSALGRKKAVTDVIMKLGEYKKVLQAYLSAITYADTQFGRLLDALKENKLEDNTIVIFWSDHGYHFGEKGWWGKHTVWERTTNVPHIWAGPGIPSGVSHDRPVSSLDIYPTLVELCGLKVKQNLDGKSIVEIFKNYKEDFNRTAMTAGKDGKDFSVVNNKWCYIRRSDDGEELYDRQKDPNQWFNLAKKPEYQNIKEEMSKLILKNPAEPIKKEETLVLEGESFKWVKGEKKKKKRKK